MPFNFGDAHRYLTKDVEVMVDRSILAPQMILGMNHNPRLVNREAVIRIPGSKRTGIELIRFKFFLPDHPVTPEEIVQARVALRLAPDIQAQIQYNIKEPTFCDEWRNGYGYRKGPFNRFRISFYKDPEVQPGPGVSVRLVGSNMHNTWPPGYCFGGRIKEASEE